MSDDCFRYLSRIIILGWGADRRSLGGNEQVSSVGIRKYPKIVARHGGCAKDSVGRHFDPLTAGCSTCSIDHCTHSVLCLCFFFFLYLFFPFFKPKRIDDDFVSKSRNDWRKKMIWIWRPDGELPVCAWPKLLHVPNQRYYCSIHGGSRFLAAVGTDEARPSLVKTTVKERSRSSS